MDNHTNNPEMPIGLGMALAQNLPAMNHFASLSKARQQQVVRLAHNVNSKEEMQAYVQSLIE